MSHSCEQEVIATLLELQRRAVDYARRDGRIAADDFFYAEQNALLVKDAEHYYRTMFRGRVTSWNLRDTHMVQSLDGLVTHLSSGGRPVKVVVWAHNSHLGPKTVAVLHNELRVNDIESLKRCLDGQAIRKLKGFGTRKVKNIRRGLDLWEGSQKRMFISVALPLAENFVERIRGIEAIDRVEIAGSLRRRRETIGDLDGDSTRFVKAPHQSDSESSHSAGTAGRDPREDTAKKTGLPVRCRLDGLRQAADRRLI